MTSEPYKYSLRMSRTSRIAIRIIIMHQHITYRFVLYAGYSLKRSDVTGNRFEWELGEKRLYMTPPPPPYIIVLASSVTTKEVKAIEFRRIPNQPYCAYDLLIFTVYHPEVGYARSELRFVNGPNRETYHPFLFS